MLSVIIACLAAMVAFPVFSNPEGGVVTQGSAIITQSPRHTVIQQSSDRAAINWRSFNIEAGEKTQFVQPSSDSVTLNRISPDGGVSQIYGSIVANGKVILVNQAGIHFSPSATVDVAGLIASTTDITNANFMAGKFFFDQSSSLQGSIINEGIIQVASHGLIALVGNNVTNNGTVIAHGGNVILASGKAFVLSFDKAGLINFIVNESESRILGEGTIEVSPARISDVIDSSINVAGVAQATSASMTLTGEVILSSDALIDVSGEAGGNALLLGAEAAVHGTILAEGTGNGRGGFIETSGHVIDITGARVSTMAVSGSTGMWLLDPADITIQNNGGVNSNEQVFGTPTVNTYTPTTGAASSIIDVGVLTAQLANSNVRLCCINQVVAITEAA